MTPLQRAAPIGAAVCVFVGTRIGERNHGGIRIAADNRTLAFAIGVLLAGVTIVRGPSATRAFVVGATLVVLGSVFMTRAIDGLQSHPLAHTARDGVAVEVRGTVAADPEPGRFTTELVVRVTGTRVTSRQVWQPTRAMRMLARFGRADASAANAMTIGDHVELFGWAEPLDGFDARRRWEHVAAGLRSAEVLDARPATHPLWRTANALRDRLSLATRALPASDRALLAGFLVGDTRNVDDRTRTEFRDSGLSHLLAVSGANVAFVLALASPWLRSGPLTRRFGITLMILLVFGAVTRFEPSVLRAEVMAATAALASLAGRPLDAPRRLAYAVIVLLLVDPFLAHSVSFGLSVGASAGIVVCAATIRDRLKGPDVLRAALAVTLAAQLGALPVAITTFGSQPGISPVTNLLAAPAAEPLTMVGFVVAAIVAVGGNGLAPLQWPVLGLLTWVRAVAALGARVPVRIGPHALLVVAFLVAAFVLAYRWWRPVGFRQGTPGSGFPSSGVVPSWILRRVR